jgi:MFS family permease
MPPVRQILAVVAGNALEFYDFGTYSFFAVQIGQTFFPTQNPLSSLLLSFATFGAGFLTRPIGAVVMGRVADRRGRNPAMMLTFLLMGVSVAAMALTPSYRSIGIVAPILVVVWRLLQGFAVGGEVGPTTAFLTETAPPRRRGLFGSFQTGSTNISILAAGVVGFALSNVLNAQALGEWGWRCAFLIGTVVVPVGLFVRRYLPETLQAPETEPTAPGAARAYVTVGALGLGMIVSGTVLTYVRIYLTTYAVNTMHFDSRVAFVTTMVNGLCGVCAYPVGGWISDRVGRKPIMIISTLVLTFIALPAMKAIVHFHTPGKLYAGTAVVTLLMGVGQGPVLTTISELLPRSIRAGVLGTLYAVGVCVFGGTTQFMVEWIMAKTDSPLVPGWYMTAAGALGVVSMFLIRETAPARSQERVRNVVLT